MAIKETDPVTGKTHRTYVGRVLEVRKRPERRNLSDTLDYTDFRTIEITEAYVYVGHSEERWGHQTFVPIGQRFRWIDCTNIFAWRGQIVREPHVDVGCWELPEIAQELALHRDWEACEQETRRVEAEKHAASLAEKAEKARQTQTRQDAKRQADIARMPKVGTMVLITKGKNKGFTGVVSFVKGTKMLVKPTPVWRDRSANGIWATVNQFWTAQNA